MYGKYVGLDIGSDSIKVAVVKRGLKDIRLLETLQFKTPDSPEEISKVIDEIFTTNSLSRSDVATAIPNHPVSVRVLSFPFSDPSKVDQVYEFELESLTTFDPVDKVHGYHIVKSDKGCAAIVCMFEKEHLKTFIDLCDGGMVDPKVVTFAPLSYSSLNHFLTEERPLVLINVGASDMSFALFDQGGIKRVRSSSKAGTAVTDVISQTLHIPFDEAKFIKLEGFSRSDRGVIREAMAPVLSEIKKTIQFFEMELRQEVKTVLLSGGMSFLPGINEYLTKELKKDVKGLFIPELGDSSRTFGQAYALALYGCTLKKGYLDLRKGEFKYTGKNEELKKTFLVPAVLLAVFLLLIMFRSISGYLELKERVGSMEAQIEQSVRQSFPQVKIIPKPIAFMENEVKKVREQLGLVQGIQGASTPLNVLRDISASVPRGVNATVDEVNFINEATVKVLGRCDSYEDVAKLEKSLSDAGGFKKVMRDSTETAANNIIKFQLSLVMR